MMTFVCMTHLASAIHMGIQKMHVSHITCDRRDTEYIFVLCGHYNGCHATFNSARRSLKSCLKLFYRIPTALYFIRESL